MLTHSMRLEHASSSQYKKNERPFFREVWFMMGERTAFKCECILTFESCFLGKEGEEERCQPVGSAQWDLFGCSVSISGKFVE